MPPLKNPAWLSLSKKRRIWRITVLHGNNPSNSANCASSCHFAKDCSNCCLAYWSSVSGANSFSSNSWQRCTQLSTLAGSCHCAAISAKVRINSAKPLNTSNWLTLLCHALTPCHMPLPLSGSIQPKAKRSTACCQVKRLSLPSRMVWSKPQCTFNPATVSCSSGTSSSLKPKRCSTNRLSSKGKTLSTSNRLSSKSKVCAKAYSKGWRRLSFTSEIEYGKAWLPACSCPKTASINGLYGSMFGVNTAISCGCQPGFFCNTSDSSSFKICNSRKGLCAATILTEPSFSSLSGSTHTELPSASRT